MVDHTAHDPHYFMIGEDNYQYMFDNFRQAIATLLAEVSDDLMSYTLFVRQQAMRRIRSRTDFLIQQMDIIMNITPLVMDED